MLKRYIYVWILTRLIVKLEISNLVYVDESGINQNYQREHARAKKGVKIQDTKRGKKFKRTNIIGALWNKKHIAMKCYDHSTKALFFEDWFEFDLLPLLPEKTIVIMDNASFHRKKYLREIAKKHGIILLFLPPYSPDYNPIEKSWANFKRWLRDNINRFPNLDFAVDCYFYT